ncbi:type I restriction-modification system subunit M N-terminal domain-containing protein, partial [Thiolapillus sp.]
VSAAEYKYPVLGLIFLKYVSDLFEAQADVIRQHLANPKSNLYQAYLPGWMMSYCN